VLSVGIESLNGYILTLEITYCMVAKIFWEDFIVMWLSNSIQYLLINTQWHLLDSNALRGSMSSLSEAGFNCPGRITGTEGHMT
jgi:hypothetical protein